MRTTIVVAVAGLVLACASGPGPAAIAQEFWDAVDAGDAARTSELMVPGGDAQINSRPGGPGAITLGDATVDGDAARVATNLVHADGPQPITIDFATVVVRHEGAWLVDLDATTEAMLRALSTAVAGS